jgi:hypothetical protein
MGDSSDVATATEITGDATLASNGVVTLSNSGVSAATVNDSATAVTPITIDAKGRVTGTGSAVTITPSYNSLTDVPTTLSGYGITDAVGSSATAGRVLLGDSSNLVAATEVTGDVTIDSSGVTAIGTGVIVNADISATAAIAGSKIAPDFGAQNVLTTGTITGANLNVTGTALPTTGLLRPTTNVLAFATNTLERARITADGRMLINTTSGLAVGSGSQALLQVSQGTGGALGATFYTLNDGAAFGGTIAIGHARLSQTGALLNNDIVGQIRFASSDGVSFQPLSAIITAAVDGTVSAGSTPGRLIILTTPSGSTAASERVRVTSNGNVLINNTTGTERLSVTGNIQLTNTADSYKVGTNNVVGSRKTGWAAPAGTATRTTFDTTTVTAEQLAERVKALVDDLTSHGLIGA